MRGDQARLGQPTGGLASKIDDLEVFGLNAFYGMSHVLFDISLSVRAGETVALIGRNGAGKTTTLHSIMGVLRTRTGSVQVNGRETIRWEPHKIARLGVGIVPETRRVFADLTVEENLRAAEKAGPKGTEWTVEMMFDTFPSLTKVRQSKGDWLSGGEQQMLAVARTLVGNPTLLLLDEPTEGLAPRIVDALEDHLRLIQATGIGILLAEQNLVFVEHVADRAYVIDKGTIYHEGAVDSLVHDEDIKRRHLVL